MASEITPGQWVNVKVTSEPKAEARKKTMVRLFEQDQGTKRERERLARARVTRRHRRGGRLWADIPPRLQVVKTTPGATYKLFASVDVLRDLNSIANCVEVTPDK